MRRAWAIVTAAAAVLAIAPVLPASAAPRPGISWLERYSTPTPATRIPISLEGSVRPKGPVGRKILVQRFELSGWRTVGVTRTTARRGWSTAYFEYKLTRRDTVLPRRIGSWHFRAVAPARPGVARIVSPVETVWVERLGEAPRRPFQVTVVQGPYWSPRVFSAFHREEPSYGFYKTTAGLPAGKARLVTVSSGGDVNVVATDQNNVSTPTGNLVSTYYRLPASFADPANQPDAPGVCTAGAVPADGALGASGFHCEQKTVGQWLDDSKMYGPWYSGVYDESVLDALLAALGGQQPAGNAVDLGRNGLVGLPPVSPCRLALPRGGVPVVTSSPDADWQCAVTG